MSARRSSDPQESQPGNPAAPISSTPSETPTSGVPKLQLMGRTRMLGMSGLHASSIGWTLVGCIALGFGLGTLLDRQLGTSYWVAVGVLLGTAAGFREMFRTLTQLQKSQDSIKRSSTAARANKAASTPSQSTSIEAERPRPRVFAVPDPPVPSYLQTPDAKTSAVANRETEETAEDAEVEELIEKLMAKHPPDGLDQDDLDTKGTDTADKTL